MDDTDPLTAWLKQTLPFEYELVPENPDFYIVEHNDHPRSVRWSTSSCASSPTRTVEPRPPRPLSKIEAHAADRQYVMDVVKRNHHFYYEHEVSAPRSAWEIQIQEGRTANETEVEARKAFEAWTGRMVQDIKRIWDFILQHGESGKGMEIFKKLREQLEKVEDKSDGRVTLDEFRSSVWEACKLYGLEIEVDDADVIGVLAGEKQGH